MNWDVILELEPKVKNLYDKAVLLREKEAKTPSRKSAEERVAAHKKGECFCKTRTWREKYKPQLDKLVGPEVFRSSGAVSADDAAALSSDPLASPVVREITYEKFCEVLPPCRNCEHDDAVQAAYESGEIKELKSCLGNG